MSRAIDISGKRFGRLQATEADDKNGGVRWLCKCDCGALVTPLKSNLLRGSTKSCGCLRKELGFQKAYRFKKAPGVAALSQVYASYKKSARLRDIEFSLTKEQFFKLTQSKCIYCGSEFSNKYTSKRRGSFKYNGIDRVDNSVGYVSGNCVPCCRVHNSMKAKQGLKEFILNCWKICDYLGAPEEAINNVKNSMEEWTSSGQ